MTRSTAIGALLLLGSCTSPPAMPGSPATSPDHTVQAHVAIAAPAREVYRTLTEADGLVRFVADRATTRPVEGGELWLGFGPAADGIPAARGVFLALLPPTHVAFRIAYPAEVWQARGVDVDLATVHETDVTIRETGPRECDVDLVDRIDARASLGYVAAVSRTWTEALANLKSVLEGGPDLRTLQKKHEEE
jgi:uncharacterized protein YndB with AHSA1/START domain